MHRVGRALLRFVLAGGLAAAGSALAQQPLSADELRQLAAFSGTSGMRDVPEWARARVEPQVQRAYARARERFAGRGSDIARHFLTHAEVPPANDAYFFVLEALADVDTALVLIHGMSAPVRGEASARQGTEARERDNFVIPVAIEAVLVDDAVRGDPRVVDALVQELGKMRRRPYRSGLYDAQAIVRLLGRCTGPGATAALQQAAADPEASLRAVALEALGRLAAGAARPGERAASFAVLVQRLRADTEPRARIEAAGSLASLNSADAVGPLRAALESERDPQVVDALVLALSRLKAPWPSSEACRALAARTWEPGAGRILLSCWQKKPTEPAMAEVATRGATQLRALALDWFAARAAPSNAPLVAPLAAAAAPRLDAAVRERLLESAVELLSLPTSAAPGSTGAISGSTAWLVQNALWELSGRDMALALRHADRVVPAGARYASDGRYGASYSLWNRDRIAYARYRRPRQAGTALALALVCCGLLLSRRVRRAGALLALPAIAWAVSTLSETELRELPPPPLQFLTVSALGFLSAGLVGATLALLWPGRPRRALQAVGRAAAHVLLAALSAALLCGVTRSGALFPIDSEGWQLIFDPLGSALVAVLAAIGLALVDALALARLDAVR